jgi:protein phosphatase PTC1
MCIKGLLAVTRSFGHAEIKQWVLSDPFVFDTQLQETDSYLIIACDGVGVFSGVDIDM